MHHAQSHVLHQIRWGMRETPGSTPKQTTWTCPTCVAEHTEVVANKVKQNTSKYRQHVQFWEFITCTLLVNAIVITVSPGSRAKSQITFYNFQEIKKFSCCRTRIHLDCTLAYRYVLVVIPWIFYIPTNQVNKIEPWQGEQSHTVWSFKCLQQLLGQKEKTSGLI